VQLLLGENQKLRTEVDKLKEDNSKLRMELDTKQSVVSSHARATQTLTATRSISVQTIPSCRSKGIQVRRPVQNDVTTQCGLNSKSVSTPPSKKPKLEDSESPLFSTADTDSTYNVEDDFSLPNTGTSVEPAPASQTHVSVHSENKYIVFQSALWQLFEDCPVCRTKCSVQSTTHGSLLRVQQDCVNKRCMFSRQWDSQPMVQRTPAGSLLMSAAILFCGASYTKTLRVFNAMGVVCISDSTFKKHSREYLQPTVYKVWRDEQESLFSRLRSMPGKLEIGGDGRADSPGHSAKYGSYSTVELRINKLIDVQLVQSNEAGGSYHMELAGLEGVLSCWLERA
jgi:hypothetical protein